MRVLLTLVVQKCELQVGTLALETYPALGLAIIGGLPGLLWCFLFERKRSVAGAAFQSSWSPHESV
jgi:hypothetical protein